MRNVLTLVAALAFAGSAMATDINIRVVGTDGSSTVEAAPGATVNYEIRLELSDTANEGLAGFGLDLSYTAGDLTPADIPAAPPMDNFTSGAGTNNLGINNPAGFGGTLIDGDLIQVGGFQNTINNTIDNAPFPLGTVITGLGHTELVVATGSVVAPADGDATLSASNLFGNVITEGETGEIFWASEAAGVGSIEDLIILVIGEDCEGIVSAFPPNDAIDARQTNTLADPGTPQGMTSIDLTLGAGCDGVVVDDFVVTEDGGDGTPVNAASWDGATLTFDAAIEPGAWTVVTLGATSTRVGYLPADVNNDGTAAAGDVLALIDFLNGNTSLELYQTDIDRSGVAGASDVLRAIDLLNGVDGVWDSWNLQSLPN